MEFPLSATSSCSLPGWWHTGSYCLMSVPRCLLLPLSIFPSSAPLLQHSSLPPIILYPCHFLLSPPSSLPLISSPLSSTVSCPLIYVIFSTHVILSSSPLLFSSPLVLPSLLWRLNLNLSSECVWAEAGYYWCCSHHDFWCASNLPAILSVSICGCFTWQSDYFSPF